MLASTFFRRVNHAPVMPLVSRQINLFRNQISEQSAASSSQRHSEEGEKDGKCFARTSESAEEFRLPTLQEAMLQPRKFREASNDTVFSLSIMGEYGARKERLVREIMRIDQVDWTTARAKLEEINKANDHYGMLLTLPYRLGVLTGFFAATTAIPLVFHLPTAMWFNENFVHEALPDGGAEALDTVWKVGNWTWGWMEPYLGTASFVLLGLQFMRTQMRRLHWKPYTEAILSVRANRLARLYPQYNRMIVRDFSKSDPFHE